ATERQQRTLECGLWIGCRLTVDIDCPARGQRATLESAQLDPAARRLAGGKIERIRLCMRTRPGESEGIGAQQARTSTGGRSKRQGRGHGQCHTALACNSFNLDPQCREVKAVVDRKARDAGTANRLHQSGTAALNGQWRTTIVGITVHYSGEAVIQHRLCHRVQSTPVQDVYAIREAVQTVGKALMLLCLQ